MVTATNAYVGQSVFCTTGGWQLGAAAVTRPFTYQWRLWNAALTVATVVQGATAAEYVPTVAGAYDCQVTGINEAGSTVVTSNRLTITAAPVPPPPPPPASVEQKAVAVASASSTKPANASGVFTPDKAVDGDQTTRWSSVWGVNGESWLADLGSVRQVSRVDINWFTSYATQYDIDTSVDGVAFTHRVTVNLASASFYAAAFAAPVSARYVRVKGITRAVAQYGISFYEVGIFGPVDTAPPAAVAPINQSKPSLDGTPQVGKSLTLNNGTWTGDPPITFTHKVIANGVDVAGMTGATWTPDQSFENQSVVLEVTATGPGGVVKALSVPLTIQPVAAPPPPAPSAPVNQTKPTVSGPTEQGQTLAGTLGTWSGSPTLTAEWLKNDVGTGVVTAGYLLAAGDVGAVFKYKVKAVNAAAPGGVFATSDPSAVVTAPGAATLQQALDYDRTGVNTLSSAHDYSEARPSNFNGDWSWSPKENGDLSAVASGSFPMLQAWGGVYEQAGGNPVGSCAANVSDPSTWAGYANGQWVRVDYSLPVAGGDLFPEDWVFNGGVTAGGGSRAAVRHAAADGSTYVRLGAGQTENPRKYLFHFWLNGYDVSKAGAPQPRANLRRVTTSVRMRVYPVGYDPAARYLGVMACDKKTPTYGNGWELMIGRIKKIKQTWRLFSMTWMPGPAGSVAAPLPGPMTGVQTTGEYVNP